MTVDEEKKCYSVILSVSRAAVKSMCPVMTILDSGAGISTMSESVAAKFQATAPNVQIVGPMTDD